MHPMPVYVEIMGLYKFPLFSYGDKLIKPINCWWKKSCQPHGMFLEPCTVNNARFSISTGDRRISETSTLVVVQNIPIIIRMSSFFLKVGWVSESTPLREFTSTCCASRSSSSSFSLAEFPERPVFFSRKIHWGDLKEKVSCSGRTWVSLR